MSGETGQIDFAAVAADARAKEEGRRAFLQEKVGAAFAAGMTSGAVEAFRPPLPALARLSGLDDDTFTRGEVLTVLRSKRAEVEGTLMQKTGECVLAEVQASFERIEARPSMVVKPLLSVAAGIPRTEHTSLLERLREAGAVVAELRESTRSAGEEAGRLEVRRDEWRQRAKNQEAQKDGAYRERNQVVALLARIALELGWNAGTKQHPAEDTTWEKDWRTIVFIDLPTGQVSWHFHDSEHHLLEGLPEYEGAWDGHSTAEKYDRVNHALRGGTAQVVEPSPTTQAAQ